MADLLGSLWPMLAVFHAVVCVFFGYLAWHFARRGSGPAWPAFVFCICFFLPVLGPLAIAAAVLPALSRSAIAPVRAFSLLASADPASHPETQSAEYGPGGFRSRLLSQRAPAPGRLQSLSALRNRALPEGNRMMKELLKDPADDLRLMAFGTLERRELAIQDGIRAAKAALHAAPGEPARYPARRKLAFLNWELVYQELTEGELSGFYLEQALEQARLGLETVPGDGVLRALQGRILARLGRWDQAQAALEDAVERGAPAQRILPRLAELAFQRRDFRETRRLLARSPDLRMIPALEPILRFWIKEPS